MLLSAVAGVVSDAAMAAFSACCNVSKSALQHCLVNLTPGSKYNISLAAVTGGGEGPRAIRFINTLPEKRVAGNHLRSRAGLGRLISSSTNIPPPFRIVVVVVVVVVVLWVLSGMFVIFFISSLGTCVCGK